MNNNSGVSAGIVRLTMLQVFPRYHLPKHLKQHAPFHLSHCKSDFLQTFQSFILFMISGKEEVHTLSAGCQFTTLTSTICKSRTVAVLPHV